MEFSQSEGQIMIAKQARDILGTESPTRVIRELVEKSRDGYDNNLWKKIADAGWLGIATPEEYGGQGGDLNDLFIVCEEMGRVSLVGPFFTTGVLASQVLLEGGSELQKREYLPSIVKGETIMSWAMQEAEVENELGLIKTTAMPQGNGYVLDGTKLFVQYAHVANYMLVLARIKGSVGEDGLTLFIVPANADGVTTNLESTIGLERLCTMTLNKVKLGSEAVVGTVGKAADMVKKVLKVATVAKMSEMMGGLASVLEMSIEYAKTRHTWGHPIGVRQVVQHRLADVFLDLNLSRILVCKAAWALTAGLPADLEISMAKSFLNEKYRLATNVGLQTHGTIAYCLDHDMQVFVRQSKAAESVLGSTDYHLAKVAEGIGL